ncbi:acyloxyacyl hydrolase [Ohtaekwangia kribbensis]|uniref:Acyloxyacyl hydrolase n=1 Tax=Ohtaekwangia kribbensis TaxID=688913 RepID=A0ABW3JZG8_9BACT
MAGNHQVLACRQAKEYKLPAKKVYVYRSGVYRAISKGRLQCCHGFAIRPFARFYPVNRVKWRLYFESGGSLVYTLTEFPEPTDRDNRLGLQLNGITKYGIGSDINISRSTSIIVSVRHLHISNGNTKSAARNPSHDSNGFSIGLAHRLK